MNEQATQFLRDAFFESENLLGNLADVDYEHFEESHPLNRMTERSFEIVGEAIRRAMHAEPSLQDSHPELREWIALRNVLSHQYDKVLPSSLWATANRDIPELLALLQTLLEPLKSD